MSQVGITSAAEADNRFRLSPFQESMWFLEQRDRKAGSFNIGRAWSLRGQLNISALQQAVNDIVARHDLLRSRVDIVRGVPYHVVLPRRPVNVSIVDMSSVPAGSVSDSVEGYAQVEFMRPFDFHHDPLVRAFVLRLTKDRHVLGLVKPHLITDATAISIFTDELAAAYSARMTGREPSLEPALQFADYCRETKASSPAMDRDLAYWREELAGAPSPVIFGRVHDVNTPFAIDEARFPLTDLLVTRLVDVAENRKTTLFAILLTAYALVLRQISGADDLVIGGLATNRLTPEEKRLVGPTVNTFALRFRMTSGQTLADAIETGRRIVARSYRHSLIPFERVIESLRGGNQLPPDFRLSTVFDYFTESDWTPSFAGLKATPLFVARDRSQVEFTTKVRRNKRGAMVTFTFQRSSFTQAEMSEIFRFYRQVLRRMVSSPEVSLSDIGRSAPRITTRLAAPAVADQVLAASPADVDIPVGLELTQIQSVITDIWKEVLGVTDVDLDDDFFQLGGHSMTAMQIALRIWDELKVEVPVESLFSETVTIRTLSESVAKKPPG